MNVQEAFLLVSILINVAFILGLPIAAFVRFLLRRTRWRIIGQGAGGVDVREGRPKNGYYVWNAGGGKRGLIKIDMQLVDNGVDGRSVLWVDTDNAQQITPDRFTEEELAALPADVQTMVKTKGHPLSVMLRSNVADTADKQPPVRMEQLPGWRGEAANDKVQTVLESVNVVTGKPETRRLSYMVWQRISGYRLFKAYKDIRIGQLNDPNAGLAAVVEKLVFPAVLICIVLLIALMIMGA